MHARGIAFLKVVVVLATVPLLLWAYEYGPDPGYSGVPNENGSATGATCANSSCHIATPNATAGSVKVNFAGGRTYFPGVKQHIYVTITDPAATQKLWGFQLTARVSSSNSTMAGSFKSTDKYTTLICSQTNLRVFSELKFGTAQTCPGTSPLQYIEHSDLGANILDPARVHAGSGTYEFDWTPPATNVGNIDIYVAGNAANGDNRETGDHIFTNKYTLTPLSPGGTPQIDAVEHGASYVPGYAGNTFIQIKGSNLSTSTNLWDEAIAAGKLPPAIDGVSVSVGNKPAYVYFVSPGQINVLTADVGAGAAPVVVTTPGGTSNSFLTNVAATAPAFFLWAGKYAVATRNSDGSYAVPNGTFPGLTTTPAKPGDVILLWGTGFGPTNPTTAPGITTPGDPVRFTASPVTITIGNIQTNVIYSLLAPNFAGLYQIAITVPDNAPNGDQPVVATVGGASSPATTLLTIQR
jgi:uncharacterized protein (TIGR03437 family)